MCSSDLLCLNIVRVDKVFPFLGWIKNYNKDYLAGDLLAGVVVGIMLIPQGMAYAMIAGLPPIYGIYAAFFPQVIYQLFGTSRQIAIGPVATDSILIASGIGAIAATGSVEYTDAAILLSLMVGTTLLLMRVFRLGFLVNFLSRPVISGFTLGAAFIIIISQLKYLLGIQIERSESVFVSLQNIFLELNGLNELSLLIGLLAIAVIVMLKKVTPKIPGILLVVGLGIYFSKTMQLDINVVGDIPAGLPVFSVPNIDWSTFGKLLVFAITFSLIIYMEAMAIGKSFESSQNDYKIDANKELLAMGITNIVGSFFQSFPVSAGFSRTAVNVQSGAKTGLAAIISATVIGLVLLFLIPLFYYLPHAVLAAIIIVAVMKLIDLKLIRSLWVSDKKDFYMLGFTAISTLVFGILTGLMLGVGLSLIMVIYRVSYPHIAIEGRIKGTNEFRNVKRFANLEEFDDLVVVRLDAQLFFANLNYFESQLSKIVSDKGVALNTIIINAIAINGIDSSASFMLDKMVKNYREKGIETLFAAVKGPIRDKMKKTGLYETIGSDKFFLNVDNAIKYAHGEQFDRRDNIVSQSNFGT